MGLEMNLLMVWWKGSKSGMMQPGVRTRNPFCSSSPAFLSELPMSPGLACDVEDGCDEDGEALIEGTSVSMT